ncbi:MAG: helix-turn-helix domain-containing protein [Clostridia bacterium]|nr:helix-turn-helix domain-containing protein [Clostridia bacterium]
MNVIVDAGKYPLNHRAVRHGPSEWVLIYCTGGSGTLRFESGQSLEFSKGMIAGIPPEMTYTLSARGSFTGVYVCIHEPFFYQKKPFVFSDNREGLVLNAFQGACLHFAEKGGDTHFIRMAYAYLIMAYAKCYHKEQIRSETVREILDNIHENYSSANYELDKYLESLPFSADYIRKLFKGEIGVTPHRYLSDLRLSEAEGWLYSQGKEANITEIARRCGFREPLYFSRMFKKKYGRSPSHYAEEMANVAGVSAPDGGA